MPYYIKLEKGECIKKVCGTKCPEGFIETNNPEEYKIKKHKKFNPDEFFLSLLSDDKFRDLIYTDIFPAIGLSINNNLKNIKEVLSKMIFDGKISSEIVELFKQKLFDEYGIEI